MEVKAVLGFDVDGTLTKRNTEKILPEKLPLLFNFLDELGYYIIPVTGKPYPYALRIIQNNNLQNKGAIAENAGVYVKPGQSRPNIFGPNVESISQLKKLIGLEPESSGKVIVNFKGIRNELIVDPEDISILTLFTNPDHVKHKWEFKPSLTTNEVWEALENLIISSNLSEKIKLLPAFPDGGVQVIRMDKDKKSAVDKSKYPEVVKIMYDLKHGIPLTMFGDGHNDIPAMNHESVIPITFGNSEMVVKKFAPVNGGYTSPLDAIDGGGVVDGIRWLINNKDFFENDKLRIETKIRRLFPELN